MASPPLQGRARWVKKPQQNTRGPAVVGPLVRPSYESLGDVEARARSGIAAYVDQHPEQRSNAYNAAHALGLGAGVFRGGYHMAKGLADTGVLAARFQNPIPDLLIGRTPAAVEVFQRGMDIGRYAANGIANPQRVGSDIKAGWNAAKVALMPSASPMAPNTSDELARRLAIGMNQGEVGANVAAALVGGPLAKTVGKAGEALAVTRVPAAKYVGQGYTPAFADYLAEQYPTTGMGSHWVPRRLKPPAWFVNSAYNKLQPPGTQRGEMFELHGVNDLSFNGAFPPKRFRGEAWRFSKSGLTKNGLLGRVWNGAPGPTKARAGGLAATTGSGLYVTERERD